MATTTKTNRADLLRTAPLDCWVALTEDESRIVATGSSYAEVVQKSEQLGVTDPLILKTPKDWLRFAV